MKLVKDAQTDSSRAADARQAKAKKKVEKPSPVTLAFRQYETTSYYLATKKVFDFSVDDTAREAFWNGDLDTINLCIANRLSPEEGTNYKVPKGDHIEPGLAVRTDERERVMKLKKDKEAVRVAAKACARRSA